MSKRAIINELSTENVKSTDDVDPAEEIILKQLFNQNVVKSHIATLIEKFQMKSNESEFREYLEEGIRSRKYKQTRKVEKTIRKEEKMKVKEFNKNRIEWLKQNVPDLTATTESTAECVEPESKSDEETGEGDTSTNEVKEKVNSMVKPKKSKLPKEQPIVEDVDKNEPTEDDEKMVDSFFVTSTGDNFFSSTKNNPKDKPTEENVSFFENQYHQKPQPRTSNRFQENSFNDLNKFNRPQVDNNEFSNRKIRRIEKVEVDPSLHPSWIAKKNQKTSMVEFAGKKIVFDDESGDVNTIVNFKSTTKLKSVPEVVDPTLHPSWIAKKNQKAGMVEFKGKKVVFDD